MRARRGESLGALSQRTGNVWSLEQTAVANAVTPDARLAPDYPVKIAVEEAYTSR